MRISWVLCLVPLLAAPVLGQNAVSDDMDKCYKLSGDPAIDACTRAIDSGQLNQSNLAIMHYNRGCEWNNKMEPDRAIADFDEAIRLNPGYTSAYNNRGQSWRYKGDYDRSIADFNQALKLDPNHANSYYGLGRDYYAEGDYDKAIANYDQAVQLNPQMSGALFNRGIAHASKHDWTAATADFLNGHELNSKDAYPVLWLALIGMRLQASGWTQHLEDQSKTLSQDWPWPLVRFYDGQLTAEQVLAATNDPDAGTQQTQLCEAAFYLGEWKLNHGQTRDATTDLEKAQSTCPRMNAEYYAAVDELKHLGAH